MSNAESVFKASLSRYFKAERDRTESCLGDIIKILEGGAPSPSEQIDRILERLTKHYSRDHQ